MGWRGEEEYLCIGKSRRNPTLVVQRLRDVLLAVTYQELCGLELAAHFKHYGYDLTAIR